MNVTITKFIDNLYCVNVDKYENKINKNICMVIIIDNTYINSHADYKKHVIEILPNILKIYDKCVNLKIYLISYKSTQIITEIIIDEIYTKFNRTINNTNVNSYNDFIIMINESDLILKKIDNEIHKEILILTKRSQLSCDILSDLSNNENISLNIINNVNTFDDYMCKLCHEIEKYYEKVKISLDNEYISVNLLWYNNFFLNYQVENITINDIDVNVIKVDTINPNNILNAISYVIDVSEKYFNFNLEIINQVKNYLIKIINSDVDEDIRIYGIIIYDKFKTFYEKIILKKIESKNSSEENIEYLLFDYAKKAKVWIVNDKLKYNLNKKIINNIFSTNDINSINNINEKIMNDVNNIEECIDKNILDKSYGIFNSTITLTNWLDEIKNSSCLGLLIKIKCNDLVKVGLVNNVVIENISTTYFPITDFIFKTYHYFEKNKDKSIEYGNLSKNIIIADSSIGDCNAILPVYINKYHWVMVKPFLDKILGIIISNNPFGYIVQYNNLYFVILIDMIIHIFNCDSKNYKYLRCFITLLRTCAEICFENKYNYGIRKLINNYINNPITRISKSRYPYDMLFSQSLSSGYIIENDKLNVLMLYMIEELIRQYVKLNKFNNDYLYHIKNLNSVEFDEEVNNIVTKLEQNLQYDMIVLYSYYHINNIFGNVIKGCGSYSKFIKLLEENYGVFDDAKCQNLLDSINDINIPGYISFLDIYTLIKKEYNKYNIMFYIVQGIMHAKNNIRRKIIEDGSYIDIININVTREMIIDIL